MEDIERKIKEITENATGMIGRIVSKDDNTIDIVFDPSRNTEIVREPFFSITNPYIVQPSSGMAPAVIRPDKDIKNKMLFEDKKVKVMTFKERNGVNKFDSMCDIIPDITRVLHEEGSPVVVVFFADGTKEKATVSVEDKSVMDSATMVEMGISICVTKKMLSMKTNGQGSAVYNKLIKHAFHVIENGKKQKISAENKKNIVKLKKDKAENKKAKRKEAKKEEEIEKMTEAFSRAIIKHFPER